MPFVESDHLKYLAQMQIEASEKAQEAAAATNTQPVPFANLIWVTHGVFSGPSNQAVVKAIAARSEAAQNMAKAASDIAADVIAAKVTYAAVDEDLSVNINDQVLDR